MPAKPTKYGVKIWVLADSCNDYVSNFEVYVGKPSGEETVKLDLEETS